MHVSPSLLHDLVFVLALWFFTLLFTNCKTKTLKNLFYLILFYEIVLACSLIVWEQFLALTSLASLPKTKLKHTFLGLFIIQLVLRGGLKPANFKDYISPNCSQCLLKELEQEVDLVHLYNWLSETHNIFWK